ncbi:MAG: hypothetical protein AAF065_11075 [Verrucomicrobiota bacterium]
MKILEKLFQPEKNSADGLNQTEREAIVDLLLFGIYMDNHLSFSEDNVLKNKIELLDWNSSTPVDLYINTATDKVRQSIANENLQNEFLQSLSTRITSEAGKRKALNSVTELFRSDGEDPREYAFREAVTSALK